MHDRDQGDPVRDRRAKMAKAAEIGQRVGYGLFGLAVVAFALGAVTGLTPIVAAVVVTSLVLGSIVLAPAIVLGFAARAAERDDRDAGR